MPLKHHTETAYLFLLALVTSAYGVLLSLLPHFPEGVFYWPVLMLVAIAYPLVLWPAFRSNRADYEFRFLHWAPAFMTLLWLVLELLAGRFQAALILQLGFLYLWSLPLVVLTLTMIILFCLHVIRRQIVRVTVVGGLLAIFFVMSVSAEALGWNESMRTAFFPQNGMTRMASSRYRQFVANLGATSSVSSGSSSSAVAVAMATSSSSSAKTVVSSSKAAAVSSVSSSSSKASSVSPARVSSSSRPSSSSSVSSVTMVAVVSSPSSSKAAVSSSATVSSSSSTSMTSSSSSAAAVSSVGSAASRAVSSTAIIAGTVNPPAATPPPSAGRLPSSGPEGFAILFITLLAIYCRTLHVRAVRRLDVD